MNNNLIEFAKEQSVVFPEDSAMGWYLRETLRMLQAEPCEELDFVQPHKKVPVNLEPCEDAVSRAKAMEICKSRGHDNSAHCISELPSVKPTRKKGKWILPKQDDGMSDPIEYQVRCSRCGFDIDPQTYALELKKFGANKCCPNCGAEMEDGK